MVDDDDDDDDDKQPDPESKTEPWSWIYWTLFTYLMRACVNVRTIFSFVFVCVRV